MPQVIDVCGAQLLHREVRGPRRAHRISAPICADPRARRATAESSTRLRLRTPRLQDSASSRGLSRKSVHGREAGGSSEATRKMPEPSRLAASTMTCVPNEGGLEGMDGGEKLRPTCKAGVAFSGGALSAVRERRVPPHDPLMWRGTAGVRPNGISFELLDGENPFVLASPGSHGNLIRWARAPLTADQLHPLGSMTRNSIRESLGFSGRIRPPRTQDAWPGLVGGRSTEFPS